MMEMMKTIHMHTPEAQKHMRNSSPMSVQMSRIVCKKCVMCGNGLRGWCVYHYGSEAPDPHFTANNTRFDYAVLLRQFFRTSAHVSGHSTPITFSPTGLTLVQIDADLMELQKDIVGVQIGLNPDSVTDWEF